MSDSIRSRGDPGQETVGHPVPEAHVVGEDIEYELTMVVEMGHDERIRLSSLEIVLVRDGHDLRQLTNGQESQEGKANGLTIVSNWGIHVEEVSTRGICRWLFHGTYQFRTSLGIISVFGQMVISDVHGDLPSIRGAWWRISGTAFPQACELAVRHEVYKLLGRIGFPGYFQMGIQNMIPKLFDMLIAVGCVEPQIALLETRLRSV
jgi:hypothetical protein